MRATTVAGELLQELAAICSWPLGRPQVAQHACVFNSLGRGCIGERVVEFIVEHLVEFDERLSGEFAGA
eukprot:14193915-Alexandrium_andersonii.AAC.1